MTISFFKKNRFIHSVKTAIAVLIGFLITHFFHFQIDQWIVISIIVVMCGQMNVGSILQKSYMRLLGTLIGSLIAALTLIFFSQYALAIPVMVVLSTFFFSYLATGSGPKNYSDAGTLGAVTVAVILITPHPTLTIAGDRFLEMSAGIVIAALVSQLILPIHARKNLRDNQAQTLRLLHRYYLSTLLANPQTVTYTAYENIDESIGKSLITQRKLATDAAHEPLGKSYNIKLFKKSLWCEKEILRSITFMFHAYNASPQVKELFISSPVLKNFHEGMCQAIEKVAYYVEKKITYVQISLPEIDPVKTVIQTMLTSLSSQETLYAHSFLFGAEVLVSRMQNLITLVKEMNSNIQH